jgi:hypothetical protein
MNKDSDVKEITLTGEATKELYTPKKRRTHKNGGGSTSAGTIVQLQTTTPQSFPQDTPDVTGILPKSVVHSAEVKVPLEPISGGAKKRVILKEAPKKHHKVTLSVSKQPKIINYNLNFKNICFIIVLFYNKYYFEH